MTLTYRFESEVPPIRPLRLKIEINTREHFAVLAYHPLSLVVENPWFTGEADVTTYPLDELMGTKLRALYQRRNRIAAVRGDRFQGVPARAERVPSDGGADGLRYLSAHSVRGFTFLARFSMLGIIDAELPGGAQ